MTATVHLTDEELNDLRELTHVDSADEAVRTALDEYRRHARRMRLKEMSGQVGIQENSSSVTDFIGKWAGAFSLPEPSPDDARFAYLIGKHAK